MHKLILILIACGTATLSTAQDVHVAYPPFEPFYEIHDGQHAGICPTAIKAIFANTTDINLIEEPLPLPRMIRGLINGDIDIVGCLPCDNPELEDYVKSSIPYIFEEILLFHQKDKDLSQTLQTNRETLHGATVRQATTARYINPEKLTLLENWSSLVQFIHRGRADYGVIPKSILQKLLLKDNDFDFYKHLVTQRVNVIEACILKSNNSEIELSIEKVNDTLRTKYQLMEVKSETEVNKSVDE